MISINIADKNRNRDVFLFCFFLFFGPGKWERPYTRSAYSPGKCVNIICISSKFLHTLVSFPDPTLEGGVWERDYSHLCGREMGAALKFRGSDEGFLQTLMV